MSDAYEFTIAADDACLEGHFPSRALVPGVVVLDHVVRVAGLHNLRVTGIVRCKFLSELLPGTECTVLLQALDGQQFSFVCRTRDALIAKGTVKTEPRDDG